MTKWKRLVSKLELSQLRTARSLLRLNKFQHRHTPNSMDSKIWVILLVLTLRILDWSKWRCHLIFLLYKACNNHNQWIIVCYFKKEKYNLKEIIWDQTNQILYNLKLRDLKMMIPHNQAILAVRTKMKINQRSLSQHISTLVKNSEKL